MATPTDVATRAGVNAFFDLQTAKSVEKAGGCRRVGYPGDTLMAAMANRNRDYAPSDPGEMETRALGAATEAGAEAFFAFLTNELMPLIEDHYPVDLGLSTLQGISLGGLFGAWVLFKAPETFANYILGSPAIWWKGEEVWDWEAAWAESNNDLTATVFVSAGELEVAKHQRADAEKIASKNPGMRKLIEGVIAFNDKHGWPEIANLTPRFAERLSSRGYPGLRIHCHNFPDETHMSAPPMITSRGLRYVFGSWQP